MLTTRWSLAITAPTCFRRHVLRRETMSAISMNIRSLLILFANATHPPPLPVIEEPLEPTLFRLEDVQRPDVHRKVPRPNLVPEGRVPLLELQQDVLEQPSREIDVVLEMPEEVAGPDVVGDAEPTLPEEEQIPQRAGHPPPVDRPRILGEPHGQVRLTGVG